MNEVLHNYLADVRGTFQNYRSLAEKALLQVDDDGFFAVSGPESNSIAIVVKHIAGNLKSRFTDFLTTDGEKPDRNRDTEFEIDVQLRSDLMLCWKSGWDILTNTLESLDPDDLGRIVLIRGEGHTVVEALNRQMTHYAYHIGQIVWMAKEIQGPEWKSLSVPKGKSASFNAFLKEKSEKGIEASSPLEGALEFSESTRNKE